MAPSRLLATRLSLNNSSFSWSCRAVILVLSACIWTSPLGRARQQEHNTLARLLCDRNARSLQNIAGALHLRVLKGRHFALKLTPHRPDVVRLSAEQPTTQAVITAVTQLPICQSPELGPARRLAQRTCDIETGEGEPMQRGLCSCLGRSIRRQAQQSSELLGAQQTRQNATKPAEPAVEKIDEGPGPPGTSQAACAGVRNRPCIHKA